MQYTVQSRQGRMLLRMKVQAHTAELTFVTLVYLQTLTTLLSSIE